MGAFIVENGDRVKRMDKDEKPIRMDPFDMMVYGNMIVHDVDRKHTSENCDRTKSCRCRNVNMVA
jgi:hypothetical protein